MSKPVFENQRSDTKPLFASAHLIGMQ